MNGLLRNSAKFLNQHSSTILTFVGGAGVIFTAVLTAKATPTALGLLRKAEEEKGEELTKFEMVKTAAPVYIPSLLVGASTIACIFGANALNKYHQASIMSAYALLDSSYKDYKNKVSELYGEDADDTIRAGIAKDKYDEVDITVEEDKKLFYDYFSERYFEATIETVQQAEYNVNRSMVIHDYCYLNDYYKWLGIEPIKSGFEYGWATGPCFEKYWQSWIDFKHKTVELDDGLECVIITMDQEPILGFVEYD